MNIYVGNLAYQTSEEDIRQAFTTFGQVSSVNTIKDKFSGESKGFGFVEMATQAEAQAAIAGLNGTEMSGRNMTVSEAKPKSDNSGRAYSQTRNNNRKNW